MSDKIILELSLREANIIKKTLQKNTPDTDDEMLILMLYARIARKIDESHAS